jgi:hypothetical protein
MTNRKKTYEDMAAEAEAIKDTPAEGEGLVRVSARVSENLGSVFSVRFDMNDMAKIHAAAQARGMKMGAFIRAAALAVAAGDFDLEPGQQTKAREHVRALAEIYGPL